MQKIDFHLRRALYGVDATREIEHAAQATQPPHKLMQRAGLALAQLSLALVPHAQRIWIACGPGNNGGDGLEAAMHLRQWGKHPVVTWLGDPEKTPEDAAASWKRASAAGVKFAQSPPLSHDFCIDALLGLGSDKRAPEGRMTAWIDTINASGAPVLAVDLPTGLAADTGKAAPSCVRANHTLSLLTLKPGLFTADGRDAAGTVWFDDLGINTLQSSGEEIAQPSAWLAGLPASTTRKHASHKGSYGDVTVIGGAQSMTGAALLAASSALHAGAGRVFVGLLDGGSLAVDVNQPELMFRSIKSLDLSTATVVIGCGAGDAFSEHLSRALLTSASVVIDADGLNLIASDSTLQVQLRARTAQSHSTVLTPHPLEAARLLDCSTHQVQDDRLRAALELARRFGCVIALKGSGTIIAAPGQIPIVNPTGNARLATAGTGDVLAGMIGAAMARDIDAFHATSYAVYQHGMVADRWPSQRALVAGKLAHFQYK